MVKTEEEEEEEEVEHALRRSGRGSAAINRSKQTISVVYWRSPSWRGDEARLNELSEATSAFYVNACIQIRLPSLT
ncbi:hypothetical protein E2C01_072076 [Portunus trituberculatus]|uniref:Uncharacterized protein n=1 Tax=Portunus trituberculatus TaxID=210409 RepID=A0A5B7I9S4_PORTR|nr:hypothetical protein [Portunus trituberculatus]